MQITPTSTKESLRLLGILALVFGFFVPASAFMFGEESGMAAFGVWSLCATILFLIGVKAVWVLAKRNRAPQSLADQGRSKKPLFIVLALLSFPILVILFSYIASIT